MDRAELPLRILEDDDGVLVVRCKCGAELASVANLVSGERRVTLERSFSPAGLIGMVLHSKRHPDD